MAVRTIRLDTLNGMAFILSSLQNLEPFLERAGAILVSLSQRAFQEQKFGEHKWSSRYEGFDPPHVNIAGVVDDFGRGFSSPKRRRFTAVPALIDNGLLQNSLSHAIEPPNTVAYGTTQPYAPLHQRGGRSRQLITQDIRDALNKWLKTPEGKPYREKLGHLFSTQILETNIAPRPFIGITEEGQRDITDELGDFLEESARGGA